jgi:predicted amidophosphoribosyltransferase
MDEGDATCRHRAAASALLLAAACAPRAPCDPRAGAGPSAARRCSFCCFTPAAQARASFAGDCARHPRGWSSGTGWASDVQAVPWLIQQMADPLRPGRRRSLTLLTAPISHARLEGPAPEMVERPDRTPTTTTSTSTDESLLAAVARVQAWWESPSLAPARRHTLFRAALPAKRTAKECCARCAAPAHHRCVVAEADAPRKRAVQRRRAGATAATARPATKVS